MAPLDPPRDSDSTSYLKMMTVDKLVGSDAALIGTHCELSICNQLDFLPFLCQSCNKTFCLDHRGESAHACARAGAWAERQRQANLARPSAGAGVAMRDGDVVVGDPRPKPCAASTTAGLSCKTVTGGLVPRVHCPGCKRDYCLRHRLREDHECAKLAPPANNLNSGLDRARGALEKLRAWGAARTKEASKAAGRTLPKAKPSSAAARITATNQLRRTAKGDAKTPPEKRVYVYVEAEAETARAKIPKGDFFYSRDWVVGRVLDAAAKSLQVQNVNNKSDDERDRLRVFHVEGGRVLEFGEKFGSAVVSGNTLVLLRGIGPPEDLIDI